MFYKECRNLTRCSPRVLPHRILIFLVSLLFISIANVQAGLVQPRTDANDGQNGDNPYFQRNNIAHAIEDASNSYWYTSSTQEPGAPDIAGTQWVDYKPPISILGPGRYQITAEYAASSSRAAYDALYIVNHADGTTTINRSQRQGSGYVTFFLGEFNLEPSSWVRVQDTGSGSIAFNRMKFKYLGPSPDTKAPSVPTDVSAAVGSISSIRVMWSPATDNKAVTGYKVFRNGIYLASTASPALVDYSVQQNTLYEYTVSAFDAAGNESAQSLPPAQAIINTSLDYCSVDLGTTDMPEMLNGKPYNDGNTVGVMVSGLKCRQPFGSQDQYFYFNIADNYLFNVNSATTYLEVCYYDEVGFIEPQYDSTAGVYTPAERIQLNGTNKWKTASWTLNNCRFANNQNNGADFRLFVGSNSVKIDSVRISRLPFSMHATVSKDLGVNEVYRGLSHPQYSDGDTVVAFKEGVYCKRPFFAGDEYFYFNVSDAVLYNSSSPTVYLRVTYFDSEAGMIRPEYDSLSQEYRQAVALLFEGTNTWRQHVWVLDDIKFANRQNANADFRLYAGTNQSVHISRVEVSKVPFGDVIPPSVPVALAAAPASSSSISVDWQASTDNVGVAGYRLKKNGVQIAVISDPTFIDTDVQPQNVYSYTVSAVDLSGNESDFSQPAAASLIENIDISAARELPDTNTVSLSDKVVTAIFDGFIYISGVARESGIRVKYQSIPEGLQIGKTVDVIGTMATSPDGERYIDAQILKAAK